MNNEQFTAAEFVRGITFAPGMQSRVLIGGVPFQVGDLLADMADKSGYEYRDEIFQVFVSVARYGNLQAQDIIRRMGETFAMLNCPPEPEPDDIPEVRTIGPADQPRVPDWFNLAA